MSTSDLMGSSSMDTVFVKSDFSMSFLSLLSISSVTLSSSWVFFSLGSPAFLLSCSMTAPSKNLARFSLVKRWT